MKCSHSELRKTAGTLHSNQQDGASNGYMISELSDLLLPDMRSLIKSKNRYPDILVTNPSTVASDVILAKESKAPILVYQRNTEQKMTH